MKKLSKPKIIFMISLLLLSAILYYSYLPAINLHSKTTWNFIIFIHIILLIGSVIKDNKKEPLYNHVIFNLKKSVTSYKLSKILFISLSSILFVYIIGALLSSPILNSKAYYHLMSVEQGTFSKDIEQADFNKIPIMDKDSAALIGDREMGSMLDMVSQFEVSHEYSQINVNGKPVRVSPLRYVDIIKWFTNSKNGVPGYVNVDMTTQDAEIIKLENNIKYSLSEHFGRYLFRHLRFKYPTYIFADQIFFEIDDNGTPYYVCPVKKFKIGLFGGETIGRVVLCNAVTGECIDYLLEEVPQWVDKVFSAETLVRLYNYHGMLSGGFLNSKFSQKGCLRTTNGYNYIALNDDVWVYTGVTSAASDQAIVGFVLMNQRTMETKFYPVEGVIEDSAMASAEGQVQNLGYKATFPFLINLYEKPTYFMALKDSAGLVKKYALVSVEKYRLVAIGDTVNECINNYLKIPDNNLYNKQNDSVSYEKIFGTIVSMKDIVINGTTHYFIKLNNSDKLFEFDLSNESMLSIINYEPNDNIRLEYVTTSEFNIVKQIN